MNVRRDGVGRKALPDGRNHLAEFEGCAAMADIKQDAAFSRFEKIRQQTALLIEHRDWSIKGMRVDVAGAEFLQNQLLKRTLGTKFAEIDHHGNIGARAGFDAAFYGSPVRPTIMGDFGGLPVAPIFAEPGPQEPIAADVRLGRFTERPSTASWCLKGEVLQLKGDSRFEARRHSDSQKMKCTESQTEDWTEDAQTPSSHSDRNLR